MKVDSLPLAGQRTLFDSSKQPTDREVARMRAYRKALRLIRGEWFGMPLHQAIDRLLGIKRRGRRQYGHKYVRLVSGTQLYQARAWHPVVGSVNLGLYREERAAWAAVKAWIQAGCDPCRGLPPGVLPKWVMRDGAEFIVIARKSLRVVPGRFADPVDCHRAAVEHFAAKGRLPTVRPDRPLQVAG